MRSEWKYDGNEKERRRCLLRVSRSMRQKRPKNIRYIRQKRPINIRYMCQKRPINIRYMCQQLGDGNAALHTRVVVYIQSLYTSRNAALRTRVVVYIQLLHHCDRKKPPPPGGVPIYYVPSSRTVCKRTPLEGFVPGSSRGVLLHTVLDEGT